MLARKGIASPPRESHSWHDLDSQQSYYVLEVGLIDMQRSTPTSISTALSEE